MCLGVPGRIESIDGDDILTRTGKVNFGGIRKDVHLGFIEDAVVGDYVVVHAGFAISKVDEEEAQRVFEYLRTMQETPELDIP
ncbi:HypC/HybG/HupF family hydrogenase formation chaperone [Candidatus Poribacteria bacterium]|nr:HypC/HybG/HupF family hydrogenase formation chaperone [Candidatus Poribacteria bacterium]